MGIVAEILLQQVGDLKFERPFPPGWELQEIGGWRAEQHTEATHMFYSVASYYGPGYARGPWPSICAVLMLLFACPGVGKVWYGGDTDDYFEEMTPDKVLILSSYFMQNGERPYRNKFNLPLR